jgi:hypothetical protein
MEKGRELIEKFIIAADDGLSSEVFFFSIALAVGEIGSAREKRAADEVFRETDGIPSFAGGENSAQRQSHSGHSQLHLRQFRPAFYYAHNT